MTVHHTSKTKSRPTLGSLRGASSFGGVLRSVRVVAELGKIDRERLGLTPGNDRDYFVVDEVVRRQGKPIQERH